MRKKLTAVLIAVVMLLALLPTGTALADNEGLYVLATAPTVVEINTGSEYELSLTRVFSDSDGHELSYAITSEEINQHTKVKDGIFYFSVSEAGDYSVTLEATCPSHGTLSHTIMFHVEEAPHGLDSQYGYDETPADSVTIYFTLSNDGDPLIGEDGKPLAHREITVPYFDLDLYGLERYYRYHTENGEGPYVDTNVVERPTGLHMYLYVLERFYMGLDEDQCCRGDSGVLEYMKNDNVCGVLGSDYSTDSLLAIIPTQSPTSLYMTNFWGHDENLMYYRNHVYPYMSPGWGATSDYILLSDGDTWDVAMFSDWSFWNDGGMFLRFENDEYTAVAGQTLDVKLFGYGTTYEQSNFATPDMGNIEYALLNENGELVTDRAEYVFADFDAGIVRITIPDDFSGSYTLIGYDVYFGFPEARYAPATAKLIVTGSSTPPTPAITYGDVDGSGVVDITDVQLTCKHILGKITFDADGILAADVDGSGTVDITDVQLMCKFILGKITEFPVQA